MDKKKEGGSEQASEQVQLCISTKLCMSLEYRWGALLHHALLILAEIIHPWAENGASSSLNV